MKKMKNVSKTEASLIRSRALVALFGLLLGALLMVPIIVSANTGKKPESNIMFNMRAINEGEFATVSVNSLSDEKYTLTIESKDKSTLYFSKKLKAPVNYSKIFDLSNLDDGAYTINIVKRNFTESHNFNLNDGKVEVYRKIEVVPDFKVQGEKALLELPNSMGETYAISIIDESGEAIYETVKSDETIKKLFNFSEVEHGSYTIVAASANNNFTFSYVK